MTTTPIPPKPLIDLDSVGFWDAAREGRLTVCHCRACDTWMPRPLAACSSCAQPTTFDDVTGAGTIHSFIVVRQPTVPAFAAMVPYVLALVELEEGPRITGMLLDESGIGVEIGQGVTAQLTTFPGATEPAITFRLVG